jgi:hypothetical protein
MTKYEVPVIYNGQCTFIVEAKNEQQARELAIVAFKSGDRPDEMGNEWEAFDRTGDIERVGP